MRPIMTQRGLLDRMHAEMLRSGRNWMAAEIAEVFLKMRSSGSSPGRLIRAMIGADSRFVEEGVDAWAARRQDRRTLERQLWLLAWVEGCEKPGPESWRLHLRRFGAAGTEDEKTASPSRPMMCTLEPGHPEGWEEARRQWSRHRCATFQPVPLGRLLQWMTRRWGVPEWEEPLDVFALARLALVKDGIPAEESARAATPAALMQRWGLGSTAEEPEGIPLPAIEQVFEALLVRFGESAEEELREAAALALGSRPVSFDGFAFAAADLERVPDCSGIYRFFDHQDHLLYVGKALRLRRRLASYFRPLPPSATRREELLGRIRRFEVDPLPSELEALVCEARAIRSERPPWNVQIEVHPLDRLPAAWRWPLVFIARGEDSTRTSAFVLHDESTGWMFHLPRGGTEDLAAPTDVPTLGAPGPADSPGLGRWFEETLARAGTGSRSVVRDAETAPPPLPGSQKLDPPEARLALRYYLHAPDRIDRLETVSYEGGARLASDLLTLAASPVPPVDPDRRDSDS